MFLIVWFASQSLGLWYYSNFGDATYYNYTNRVNTASPTIELILFTIFLAPVCEEILCRALVHNYLKRTMGWIASILVTSVCFALLIQLIFCKI